ncbi:MAG: Pycsar system effector family protein [Candidatus Thiodiazotropha sp.]
MEIEPDQQIDLLEKELNRLLLWIQSVETRMSWVLPLSTAMLGAMAILAPTFTKWTIFPAIVTVFAVLLLALSIVFSALSSFPRTTGPKGSLIYFGGIVSKELEQYSKAVNDLTKEEYIEDLIRQCHRNAQVAERKYTWIQRALGCLFLGAAPWVISVYLLYSIKP